MNISYLFASTIIFFSIFLNTSISADTPAANNSVSTVTARETLVDTQKIAIDLADAPTLSIEENESGNTTALKAIISDHCGEEYGYVMFNYNKDTKTARIETLHVRPPYRKKSFGSMLLTFALQTLTECKCTIVTWLASPFNLKEGEDQKIMLPKLVAFYKRHGGVVIQQREWNADIAYFPKIANS